MNFSISPILYMTTAFCVLILFCSFSFLQKPYSSSLRRINNKTCSDLKRLYDMDCVGRGLGLEKPGNKKIQDIYLRFRMKKIVTIDEARKIGLATLDLIMKNIISEPNFLREYAVEDFNESNIDMFIIFLTPDEQQVFDPDIAAVATFNDKVLFNTNDPKPPHPYKNEFVETLEEARAKVAAQQKTLD